MAQDDTPQFIVIYIFYPLYLPDQTSLLAYGAAEQWLVGLLQCFFAEDSPLLGQHILLLLRLSVLLA